EIVFLHLACLAPRALKFSFVAVRAARSHGNGSVALLAMLCRLLRVPRADQSHKHQKKPHCYASPVVDVRPFACCPRCLHIGSGQVPLLPRWRCRVLCLRVAFFVSAVRPLCLFVWRGTLRLSACDSMCACHVFFRKLDALVVLGAQLGVAALARVVVSGDSQGVCGLGQFRQYFFECPPLFGVQCFFGVECERAFGACARRGHDECADVQCALCVLVLLDGQAVLGGGGFDQQRALRRVAGVAQQSCNLRFCAASSSIAGAVACVGAAFVRDARAVLRMRVAFFLRERTKGLRDVFRCHFCGRALCHFPAEHFAAHLCEVCRHVLVPRVSVCQSAVLCEAALRRAAALVDEAAHYPQ
ncbi:hypothetical protein, conserved in T. vivax, partial [Trypanosoma vivax Y486]